MKKILRIEEYYAFEEHIIDGCEYSYGVLNLPMPFKHWTILNWRLDGGYVYVEIIDNNNKEFN